MSGDLLKESARKILDRLHPDHATFEFFNGWLNSFKARRGIRSYRRFGESRSVNMALIEKERPKIREVLDKNALAEVYNMDETGLFYRMGRRQHKERLTIAVCCNGEGSDKLPL